MPPQMLFPLRIGLFLSQVVNVLMVLMIIRIVLTWVAPRANPYEAPMKYLYAVTEPVMAPFRALIPPMGGIDFSPMLLFFLLGFLKNLLLTLPF